MSTTGHMERVTHTSRQEIVPKNDATGKSLDYSGSFSHGLDEMSGEVTLPHTPCRRKKCEGSPCCTPLVGTNAGLRQLSFLPDCKEFEPTALPSDRPFKIPFMVCTPNGELSIHPTAAQVLAEREESADGIRVLSVFGAPKTGKSTLIERGFFALQPEPDDPDWIPPTGNECEINDWQAGTESVSMPGSPSPNTGACSRTSPALGKSVVMWLWSAPAQAHARVAPKINRLGIPLCSSSAALNSSMPLSTRLRSYPRENAATCMVKSSPVPPLHHHSDSSMHAVDDTESSQSARSELVEVTILESGSFANIDESVVLALCLLLSSHLIYNGVNLLDAAHIHELTPLRDLPKRIKTHRDCAEDGVCLHEHFPRLLWLLRDCDAQLLDERRHPISPAVYLQRALKVRGFSDEAEHKNLIRKMIASFFPVQDCHVLPTPAPLAGLPLGARFLEQLKTVRSWLANVPVKKVMDRRVDAAMLLHLAQAYVDDVNIGAPLCIAKACDYMTSERCRLAIHRALEYYRAELEMLRGELPKSDSELEQWCSRTSLGAHDLFLRNAVAMGVARTHDPLPPQLQNALLQMQKDVEKENCEASRIKATELLEELYAACEERVRSGEISSLEQYELELRKVRNFFETLTSDLAQYACRMTLVEFLEARLLRSTQMLIKNANRLHFESDVVSHLSGLASSVKVSVSPTKASLVYQKLATSMSSNGNNAGQGVKVEVLAMLQHVKRKAKADLAELESELMALVMSMECDCKTDAPPPGGEAYESRDSETRHTSDAVERMLSRVCLYETNDQSDAVERTDAQAATATALQLQQEPHAAGGEKCHADPHASVAVERTSASADADADMSEPHRHSACVIQTAQHTPAHAEHTSAYADADTSEALERHSACVMQRGAQKRAVRSAAPATTTTPAAAVAAQLQLGQLQLQRSCSAAPATTTTPPPTPHAESAALPDSVSVQICASSEVVESTPSERDNPPPPASPMPAEAVSSATSRMPVRVQRASSSPLIYSPESHANITKQGDEDETGRASAGGAEEAEAEDDSVPPKSLEAALNAVVEEETCAKWAAAATAALTDLAHNEDDSAWSVALEAALEVARARAAVSLRVPTPLRDAVYNTQSCESSWHGVNGEVLPREVLPRPPERDTPPRANPSPALSGAATARASEAVGPEAVGLEAVGGANELRARSDAQSDGEDVWTCPPEPLAMQGAWPPSFQKEPLLRTCPPEAEFVGPAEVLAPIFIPKGAVGGLSGTEGGRQTQDLGGWLSGTEGGGQSRSGGGLSGTEVSYLHEDRKFISENLSSIFDRSAIDKSDACCDLDHIHFSPGECVLCEQQAAAAAAAETPANIRKAVKCFGTVPYAELKNLILASDLERPRTPRMGSPSDACDADCRSVEAEIMGGCMQETAADARKARLATEEEDSRHAHAAAHAEAHAAAAASCQSVFDEIISRCQIQPAEDARKARTPAHSQQRLRPRQEADTGNPVTGNPVIGAGTADRSGAGNTPGSGGASCWLIDASLDTSCLSLDASCQPHLSLLCEGDGADAASATACTEAAQRVAAGAAEHAEDMGVLEKHTKHARPAERRASRVAPHTPPHAEQVCGSAPSFGATCPHACRAAGGVDAPHAQTQRSATAAIGGPCIHPQSQQELLLQEEVLLRQRRRPCTYTEADLEDIIIGPMHSSSESEKFDSDKHERAIEALLQANASTSTEEQMRAAPGGHVVEAPSVTPSRGLCHALGGGAAFCKSPPASTPPKKPAPSPVKDAKKIVAVRTLVDKSPLAAREAEGYMFASWLFNSLAGAGKGVFTAAASSEASHASTSCVSAAPLAAELESSQECTNVTTKVHALRTCAPVSCVQEKQAGAMPSASVPNVPPSKLDGGTFGTEADGIAPARPASSAPEIEKTKDSSTIQSGEGVYPVGSVTTAMPATPAEWVYPAVEPLQGQLFLDGVELVVPDPALHLLNCQCVRTVSVRMADNAEGDFVDVCIDCGALITAATPARTAAFFSTSFYI